MTTRVIRDPQTDDGAILVSLGEGATWEVFEMMFAILTPPGNEGWPIAINGEDMRIVGFSEAEIEADEGLIAAPALDEEWKTFGPEKFIHWSEIHTLEIY